MYFHHEWFGFSLWRNGAQVGVGVGVTPEEYLGRALTVAEMRRWSRRRPFAVAP